MAKVSPEKKDSKESAKAKALAESLLMQSKHVASQQPERVDEAKAFCEGYKRYLDEGKTERRAASAAVALLEKAGYKLFSAIKKPKTGDKFYLMHRNKGVIAGTIGKEPLEQGVRLSIAHIDSPRLDLKPNPLYESDELAFFKTHYYGGIRKYQWVTIPLAMYGVVVKNNGEVVDIAIGDKPGDPLFTITDLLPHLAQQQNQRTLGEGIKGEELNIIVGSLPFEEETPEAVKLETMRLLNEKYGITERDFNRAEIEFVPAFNASDIGFDGGLVGGYGQDDRVCAYPALMAEIAVKTPLHTSICVLTDKEETGSDGNTGLAGDYLFHFLEDLAEKVGAPYRKMLAASSCLSADVNAGYDPTFSDVFERRNASFINRGVVLSKYGGARGKSGTSDASAEFMGLVTNLFDNESILWQAGEMGKVDIGGGGTIAKFVANRNIDVVDVGVPVLSMHSPFELTSKLDIYHTYLAFKTFAEKA